MAAAVTLQSTTMEGQFIELVQHMQNKENKGDVVVAGTNNIINNESGDGLTFTGTFTLTTEKSVGADGTLVTKAVEYLTPTLADASA